MTRTSSLAGLRCADCGERRPPDAAAERCLACGGAVVPDYDLEAVEPAAIDGARPLLERTGLEALLPVERAAGIDVGQGATPLVDAPALADVLGVGALAVKVEGCNPTGSVADREMAVAVAMAREGGATDVALPTMGNGGQAAAAAAARAGLASHSFVPSRTPFVAKAMINVHGGDMSVVEGRYADAVAAFDGAMAGADWHSLAPFATPWRPEGAKPLAYEVAAARGWNAPDCVVVPTGQVTTLVGLHRGFRELATLGLTEGSPRLVAAQAEGCAPLVAAREAGSAVPTAVDRPDTVCGPLEIPDPAGGALALDALAATDGTAVALSDEALLEGASALAERGVSTSVTGGAAVAAVEELSEGGALDDGDDVVLVDPVAANKEADLLRSHLMSKGI